VLCFLEFTKIGTPKTLFMIMMQPGKWFEVFVGQGEGFCSGFFFSHFRTFTLEKKSKLFFEERI
jgi:hypothetical protein